MKVYLFTDDRIYNFILPVETEGSYSFDIDKSTSSKLINIEARDNKWILYSVGGVKLYYNNKIVDSIQLVDSNFYIVEKNQKKYLIYVCDFASDKMSVYTYKNLNMIVGNSGNVVYKCPYIGNNYVKIYRDSDNNMVFEQSNLQIAYINNKVVNQIRVNLMIGDCINIFGFKIIVLNNCLLMNNPNNNVSIPQFNFGLNKLVLTDEEVRDIKISDRDLYSKDDYYAKAPRIRRIIEPKSIKLSPPPQKDGSGQLPLILTIGPMATMGVMSAVSMIQVMTRLSSGATTLAESWPQLAIAVAMLLSMIFWPLVMNFYNKRMRKKARENLIKKYDAYLKSREQDVINEENLEREILLENLIPVNELLNIIAKRNIGFWDKRIDQSDFLVVRVGVGEAPLGVTIEYQEQDFTVDEDELRKKADSLVEKYKNIKNVPVSYSFYENKLTALMGNDKTQSYMFMNNLLLQLLTFYSYEDLKIVVFTNDDSEYQWDYIKYLNHNFSNDRMIRFFATNPDSAKILSEYLSSIMNERIANQKTSLEKPYFLIITDDYDSIKRFDFIKSLTETDENHGFSMVILENKLSKLPSKCTNFISLLPNNSSILKNSYEKQELQKFSEEINYNINMMNIAKIISNIPIEFEDGVGSIPDSISFLEMHNVGKVEQLNVLNRWNTNDATLSLRAEVGIDEQHDIMYLDLHEKYHGPHGLIAGTTGSGKSEFIITYILSMCINYSPDDVSFILIDYKGGGLARAFENEATGASLPHLAGTITNLDKTDMDRTLVSIDSEVKRRQKIFNVARDLTGESTIDIYKYQRLFKEGRVEEPVPHLFIICDEFAELKAQQPDFMDNLISIARIGRSLGVHLILATQKPSGVVNEQIWSNTRFRVCLKVQDESDSKEMLKRPDAAYLRQAGRYFLQVGYDEYFALGQSGYSGAKYYPSDKIIKQVDRSINFINDCGQFIKSIQADNGTVIESDGEQIQATLDLITAVAKRVNKKSRRLWLPNIPSVITVAEMINKYNYQFDYSTIKAIIGEYDAPELQEQGIVTYDVLKDGNTIVYGNDGAEKEMILNSIIYSLSNYYSPEDINFYMIDFGSESLRTYEKLPHFGGYATISEENRINNLFNILEDEIAKRKKMFAPYGGDYIKYKASTKEKIPLLVVIINNFDSMKENFDNLVYNVLPDATRDSDRYGIVYIITGTGENTVRLNIAQNFKNYYAFKLKDKYGYRMIFNKKDDIMPRDIFGRGILDNGKLHEFQTTYVARENQDDFIRLYVSKKIEQYKSYVPYLLLPVLPNKIRLNTIVNDITSLKKVPIGISKENVELQKFDFISNLGTPISARNFEIMIPFVKSLIEVFRRIAGINIFVLDPKSYLSIDKNIIPNYYTGNFEIVIKSIKDYVDKLLDSDANQEGILIINGVDDLVKEIDEKLLEDLTTSLKEYEKIGIILVDTNTKFRNYLSSRWYKNVVSLGNGIWIGNGVSSQTTILSTTSRNMTNRISKDMGYIITDNSPELCKLLDFIRDDVSQ